MTHRCRTALAALAALACLWAGGAAAGSKTEAVSFQIDLAHSGSTEFTKFKTPLKLRWNVKLGGWVSYPLIAGGKVFVSIANESPAGSALVALDLKTGAIVWQTPIPNTFAQWSNAAYENGSVFVVNSDGAVEAFNAKTGRVKWGIALRKQYEFASPPLASGGVVYINGAGSAGTFYAVDEKSGKTLWSKKVSGSLFGTPALGDDGLYLALGCDTYDFNPQSGNLIWHYNYGCSGGSGETPVYSSGLLYARNQVNPDTIFNALDGTALGTFDADAPPAFFKDAGGNAMEAVLSRGILYGVHPDTGVVAWSFPGDKFLVTAPIVVNGEVIEGSGFGQLYVLNGDTGNVDWTTNIGMSFYPSNEYTLDQPLSGFGAAADTLVLPAGFNLLAYDTH